MSNDNKPYKQHSKGQASPEISQVIAQLKARVEQLEKGRESSVEKNQWGSEVRGWIGKTIYIHATSGRVLFGELKWIDRYTLCLRGSALVDDETSEPGRVTNIVVHKGAVAFMYLKDEPVP